MIELRIKKLGRNGRLSLKSNSKVYGKVVIVTGASSGIGEATAREFARRGAKVVLAARRADRLVSLAGEITTNGGQAIPVPTDLLEMDQIRNLVRTTLDSFGRIDVLANIAGWGRYDWFEELSPEDLRKQYDVNVLGLAELTRQVVPVMKSQRSGHILMMSSYASKISVPPLTVYASTKYAVEGLADGLRRELIPWGIKVSRIHPSGVKGTEFNKKAGREGGIKFRSFPLGRVTREKVARELVSLVERPRREIFLSRLYDVPVILNSLSPGLIDVLSSTWVRLKRKGELTETRRQVDQIPKSNVISLVVPSLIIVSGGLYLLNALKEKAHSATHK
jgi:NADP-dependent 3-hydroxy acid dehydrogenase YdfG